MNPFYEAVFLDASTIDELLSDDFAAACDANGDADRAAARLTAWCRSAANGDWRVFESRLRAAGLSLSSVRERLSCSRKRDSAPYPRWIENSKWIVPLIEQPPFHDNVDQKACSLPFADLFLPLVDEADRRLWSSIDPRCRMYFSAPARAAMRQRLLEALTELCAPPIYERFSKMRSERDYVRWTGDVYSAFIEDMRSGEFRMMCAAKPVLLRLVAELVDQWQDSYCDLAARFASDEHSIRRHLLGASACLTVAEVEDTRSDAHNGGRTVVTLTLSDGSRIVYKPRDLTIDTRMYEMIGRLNAADPPIDLRVPATLSMNNYGWAMFIPNEECASALAFDRFFERAGAWLALFHCLAGGDLHHENLISSGEYPIPVDLETLFQGCFASPAVRRARGESFHEAMRVVSDSVVNVGLLPAYGKSPQNAPFAYGGLNANGAPLSKLSWASVNSASMRPLRTLVQTGYATNVPRFGERYGELDEHKEAFLRGFRRYSSFIVTSAGARAACEQLLETCRHAKVRRIVRPTRFYYMVINRLRDHRTMHDGVVWSSQADFLSRLVDWDRDDTESWSSHAAERRDLLRLNVPHFTVSCSGSEVADSAGKTLRQSGISGFDRVVQRLTEYNSEAIAWQASLVRQSLSGFAPRKLSKWSYRAGRVCRASVESRCRVEADKIAEELFCYAIRRGGTASWIGLDWIPDSRFGQLLPLRSDLYNGAPGISVFLAAHAKVTGSERSSALAIEGIAQLRQLLRDGGAARVMRSVGVGGASGLGSMVYALVVVAQLLGRGDILLDAHEASALLSREVVGVDRTLDVLGGSAGAVLSLLRLHRMSGDAAALQHASACGEHLLGTPRAGTGAPRSWAGLGTGGRPLNGMAHGAAGFAYALAALAKATGRDEFAQAAFECVAFENSTFDEARADWPDLRGDYGPHWPCAWCHGAPGIGLARIGMSRALGDGPDTNALTEDVERAARGVSDAGAPPTDTLCCGTLGTVEFLAEAGRQLNRHELKDLSDTRLEEVIASASVADYRWYSGERRFNLGLFRGLAGVGYTCLRRVHDSLPNILIWE